jgi:Tol biopolymer transport system component
VRAYPDVQAGRWQVSFGGGLHPAWNPAGRELFFVAGGGLLMGVQLTPGPAFTATQSKQVVSSRVFGAYTPRSYDVSPDGKRFLIVESTAGETSSAAITVVLNWAEDLKRRGGGREK